MLNVISSSERQELFNQDFHRYGRMLILEAHSGVNAQINEDAEAEGKKYSGTWVSGLTGAAIESLPDVELKSWDQFQHIERILRATRLPILVDGDTGGKPADLEYSVVRLNNNGVSLIAIEDKAIKLNSLTENAQHILEEPKVFIEKIRRAKAALGNSKGLHVIPRLESLIATPGKEGVRDALDRAILYQQQAEVTGLLIHSRSKEPDEVIEFMRLYTDSTEELGLERLPVVVIPTTYNNITDEELFDYGANVIIYANHQFRSYIKAIKRTAEDLLRHGKGSAVENGCIPVKEVFQLSGATGVWERDEQYRP